MKELHQCAVCHKNFKNSEVIQANNIRKEICNLIKKDIVEWNESSEICKDDLHDYQNKFIHILLESEKGELTSLELQVLKTMKEHELISITSDTTSDHEWTFGERIADKIATFGGSWSFMGFFTGFLIIWITINSMIAFWKPIDPYPFILLNLLLSCLAAIQAPIIMMSQNRQEAKDRLRSQYDYQVNLKAELEIRQLHEKVDHLLSHQWERLTQIQEIQIDLLEELRKKISEKLPIDRQSFNILAIPTAHITEIGYCVHDYTMSPCQKHLDCLNCTEQVCVKGDKRLENIQVIYEQSKALIAKMDIDIVEGRAGVDRWYEHTKMTLDRAETLLSILNNASIPNGSLIKLHNSQEYSPIKRALDTRVTRSHNNKDTLLEKARFLMEDL